MAWSKEDLNSLISAATGGPLDLVIEGVTLVDVLAEEFRTVNVGVVGDYIAYVGGTKRQAATSVNGQGKYLIPGLMDAHVHIESSFLAPPEFARAVVPHGTTAVFADPHELANVFGLAGVEMFLQATEHLPLRVFLQVPSRVPTAPGLEGTGGQISVPETIGLLRHERAVSLGEVQASASALLDQTIDKSMLDKIVAARNERKPINGHVPLKGDALAALAAIGVLDDHTNIDLEVGRAKIQSGMWLMIKEGSMERNLAELYPLVSQYCDRCMFCTDDIHAQDLLDQGHMDYLVSKVIGLGLEPIKAIKAATINCSKRHRVDDFIGSITTRKIEDMGQIPEWMEFTGVY